MPIYRYTEDRIQPIPLSTFLDLGIREREGLQRLLRDQIEVIASDTMVIAEEFGEWDESKRRIDLLAIDKDANLVVIELKRTEDGGHMELQAIRYAAMVSTLTFDKVVGVFSRYLESRGLDDDARELLLEFLGWAEPNEDDFANDVRIVLASAEFSKELTSAVLWLSDHQIDIRCVRIRPYVEQSSIFLDVQQVIPLPEAEDYQIQVREKKQADRAARRGSRDLTKFDITIGPIHHESLNKRRAIHCIVKALCERGVSPEDIASSTRWSDSKLWFRLPGKVDSEAIETALDSSSESNHKAKRWFRADDELIHFGENTYAFSNQWGVHTEDTIKLLLEAFPHSDIKVQTRSS